MLAYYVAAFISASALTSGSGVLAFPDHGGHHSGGGYDNHPKPYGFEYGVHDSYSGASFDQHENSDGKVVSGSYTVQLPDGRKQIVDYHADPHGYGGYVADVKYKGQAKFPVYKPSYTPVKPHH